MRGDRDEKERVYYNPDPFEINGIASKSSRFKIGRGIKV